MRRIVTRVAGLARTVMRRLVPYMAVLRQFATLGDLKRSAAVLGTMRFSQAVRPMTLGGPVARRIVVLAPHPDDEAIGPGGTLLRSVEAGADVLCVHVTDGSDDNTSSLRREAVEAANAGGYAVQFLGHALRRIPLDRATVEGLVASIVTHQAGAIMLPFLLDDHDDHRRVSQLLWEAYKARLLPCDIEVWGYQVYTPIPGNVIVDITEQVPRKADLIRCYASQMLRRDWVHFSTGLNAFNSRFLKETPGPRYAETFVVLPLREYAEVCATYFSGDSTECYYSLYYREDHRVTSAP